MNCCLAFLAWFSAAWVVGYMVLGGDNPGRFYYQDMAEDIVGDHKAGVPIVHLALPILITGTLASLFYTLPPLSFSMLKNQAPSSRVYLPQWIHRCRQRMQFVQGEWNLDMWGFLLVLVPSFIFTMMTIYRHLHGEDAMLDDQLMEVSNSFAMAAEVIGSFVLIPVARHSSLLKVLGISPTRAVRLHIWAGRVFVFFVIIHGVMHMFRWQGLAGESAINMLIPPAACWTMDDEQYYELVEPVCVDEDTDCNCYDFFRNLTGFLSAVALLVILATSLNGVRRRMYRVFYISHVIAAPLALITAILHWNRTIVYLAPSLIYYTATSFPSLVEILSRKKATNGVEVLSMERLTNLSDVSKSTTSDGTQYICLTVQATEAAIRQFRPGYYIKLSAPGVSAISHPFTVNTVPGKQDRLRVILKVMGSFTKQLAHRLEHDASGNKALSVPIPIHMDGYLGTPNRVKEVLQHDVASMISGGIGITPYLTLLHHVHDILAQAPPNTFAIKRIVLLWICRDLSLIEYVRREYIQPLLSSQNNSSSADLKVKIIIYHTGGDAIAAAAKNSAQYKDEESERTEESFEDEHAGSVSSNGVPFNPSRFSAGWSSSIRSNLLCFLAFFLIAWPSLATVWWIYSEFIHKHSIDSRWYPVLAVAGIGLAVAVVANLLSNLAIFQGEGPNVSAEFTPLSQFDEDESSPADAIEMEGVRSGVNEVSDDEGEDPVSVSNISVEEKSGRPTVHHMLKVVDDARNPGLFTCGPRGLMKDIREHAEERCMMRLRQCIGARGASHHIALYEEAFTM